MKCWNEIRILSATLIVCALVAAPPRPGKPPAVVEVRMRAHFLVAPATVHMTIAVEPDAANRTLHIEMDGDGMFRSSDIALEGDREKKFHEISFRSVPAGHYRLQATVLAANAVRGEAIQDLEVVE